MTVAPAERLAQILRDQTARRTALPAHAFERPMTCTRCEELVSVFEASLGATTKAEHQHLDPEAYVCGQCLGASCSS